MMTRRGADERKVVEAEATERFDSSADWKGNNAEEYLCPGRTSHLS
jgi:hypothetical protein